MCCNYIMRPLILLLSTVLILSTAQASPLSDYLKGGVVGKITSKVLSQLTPQISIANAALWQNPLPYYMSLYKHDPKAETGYRLLGHWTLTLQPDSLRSEQLGPSHQDDHSVSFEFTDTLYPGSYLVAVHQQKDFDVQTPGGNSPWLLPKVERFDVGAKPKDQRIEMRVEGYPEIKAE